MHFFRSKDGRRFGLGLPVLILLVIEMVMLPKLCAGDDPPPAETVHCYKCVGAEECKAQEEAQNYTANPLELWTYCYDYKASGVVTRRGGVGSADVKDKDCIFATLGNCYGEKLGYTSEIALYKKCVEGEGAGARAAATDEQCYCKGVEYCNSRAIVSKPLNPKPVVNGSGEGDDDDAGSMTALDKLTFFGILLGGVLLSGRFGW